jgi:hypothetical protein
MFLTSPFIDQVISLKSPQGRQMSVIGDVTTVRCTVLLTLSGPKGLVTGDAWPAPRNSRAKLAILQLY